MGITPKQKLIYDFILRFRQKRGFSPSLKEIAEHFGFKAIGTVQDYIAALEKHGMIERGTSNTKRSMQVKTPEKSLPLLGRVAAGSPIENIFNDRFIEVPANLNEKSGEHFVLEVRGDSMIEDGILDGDFVVIRKSEPTNGQTIVALIDNEATIKKFYRRKGQIELQPANANYKPITVKPHQVFKIEGVLSGLIRKISN